jgi:hypothetical protein
MTAANASETRHRASALDLAFFVPFLALYGFVVQFGSLGRFSEGQSFGVSTLILATVVLIGARRALFGILTIPVLFILVILAVDLLLVGALKEDGGLAQIPAFLVYVLGCAVASSVRWTPRSLTFVWTALALGLLGSAGLTIIDYVGIVQVPGNNNVETASKVGGLYVEQASGFFWSRSAMAAYFSISITGALILAASSVGVLRRVFFLGAGATGLVCLFLTHNRSGILGPLMIVGAYGLVSGRFRAHQRLAYLAKLALVASLMIGLLVWLFPEHLEVYLVKLGLSAGYEDVAGSDYVRVALAEAVFRSLLDNPMGNGLTLVQLTSRAMSVHNIFVQVVWAAGVFGILWLVAFFAALYFRIASFKVRPRHPAYDASLWALGAWLLHGMTHNSLQTGLAWILLGVAISSYAASMGGGWSGPVPAEKLDPVNPGPRLEPPRVLAS